MEVLSNKGKLLIRNENFEAHYGKTAVPKTSKAHKKQKDETAARKPLGDLTNKSSFFPGISSKKIKAQKQHLNGEDKEELNIREEGFLHDHSQCIKAQHTTSLSSLLDLVLPKCECSTHWPSPSMKSVLSLLSSPACNRKMLCEMGKRICMSKEMGAGSLILAETQEAEKAKADPPSPRFFPELEDMYMPDESDILKSTTPLNSPPFSPDNSDFLGSLLQEEPVELMLKDE